MTDAPKQGKKWETPAENYRLKSDIGALCQAAIEKFNGKEFGKFYVQFCSDLAERYKRYGATTAISPKQMAILTKLELNNWPDGVQPQPETAKPKAEFKKYDVPLDDSVPF